MPRKFRCVNQSVLGNARQLMNAGIIPKPSWYDAAMAARPFPGALKGGAPPKQIIFKSDWILRRFYKRFPWATAHEIHATKPEETISPGAQFADKVAKLIEEDGMEEDTAFEHVEKQYVAARVEWLKHRERTLAKAMENDEEIELAMIASSPHDTIASKPDAVGMWPPYKGAAPGPAWTEAENFPQSEFLAQMQESSMGTYEQRIWEERDPKYGRWAFEEAMRDVPMSEILKQTWGNVDPEQMKDNREAMIYEVVRDRKKQWLKSIRGKKASLNLSSLRDERPAVSLEDDPYDQLFRDPNRQTPVDHDAYDPSSRFKLDKSREHPWGEWEWKPYHVPMKIDPETGEVVKPAYDVYDHENKDKDFTPWDAETKYDPATHGHVADKEKKKFANKSPMDSPLFSEDISEEELSKLAKDKSYRKKSLFVKLGQSDGRVKRQAFAQNANQFLSQILGDETK